MDSLIVRDYMKRQPTTIRSGTVLSKVVVTLCKNHITGAPVVDEHNKVIGFISERDCLDPLMVSTYHHEAEKRVDEVMATDVLTISPDKTIVTLPVMSNNHKPRIYPVVENEQLVGVISLRDILNILATKSKEA